MKITSVRIQGMHNVGDKLYTFDEINYICGNNGVGKSTILQAIQLGLLGYIPGTKKKKEDIFKHSNGKSMAVELLLSTDDPEDVVKISRQWMKTSKEIVAVVDIEPENFDISSALSDIELPVFNFTEFLGLTANKLKDWFIDFLPDSNMEINWEEELDTAIIESKIDVNKDTRNNAKAQILKRIHALSSDNTLDSSTLIRMLNSYVKDVISFQKSEISKSQSTIQSLTFYEDVPNVDAEELRKDIAKYQQFYRDKVKYEEAREQQMQIHEQLKEFAELCETFIEDPAYVDATQINQLVSAELQTLTETVMQLTTDIAEAKVECDQYATIINKGAICPFTNSVCTDIETAVDDAKEKYAAAKAHYDDLVILRDKKTDDRKAKEFEVARNVTTLRNIESAYNKRDQLKAMVKDLPELGAECAELSLEDISTKLAELNDIVVKLKANEEYNRVRDTIVSSKYVADDMLAIYKCWEKLTGVNGLQSSTSATQPFIDMKNDIDKFIHALFDDSTEAHFNIEGKANSFSFGIQRKSNYIPYELLSSGEKCLYTFALLSAIVDRSSSSLKLIMIDDMFDHVDMDRFNKLFDTISDINSSNIQMIFAGVSELSTGGDINVIKIN